MCEIMPFLYNSININFDFIGLMLQRAHTHTHTHIQLLMMFNSWDKKGATKYKEEEKKFMGCVKRKRKRYIEDILHIYICHCVIVYNGVKSQWCPIRTKDYYSLSVCHI